MKIRSVDFNNRKKAFEVKTASRVFFFPYSKAKPAPSALDPLSMVTVDKELGREGFTYVLQSGKEGTVHIEQVLEYNQDPAFMRDALLYRLTLEAQGRVEASALSKREIIRRLGTSNYRKSIDKLLALLHVLECDVDLVVRSRKRRRDAA